MPTLQREDRSQAASRNHSPMAVNLADRQVKDSLVHMKSLAQSILCSATCVASHEDLVVQQVNSFLQEEKDGDDEGVEIGEESLLRQDYGIYRV